MLLDIQYMLQIMPRNKDILYLIYLFMLCVTIQEDDTI